MQAARRAWSEAQPAMDLEKLVFIDETWGRDQHDAKLRPCPQGLSVHRFGASRRLANHDLYRRATIA